MSATASAPNFKHILIATDLSPASLSSLPYVVEIGLRYASTVYIGHVIPFGTFLAGRPQTFDAIEEEVRRGAQNKLDSVAIEIKDRGIPAKTLLGEGDVGIILPAWIKEHEIDLVAVGTTGRTGVRKLALGSVAEEIIRDAECPVLTVAATSTSKAVALRRILHATDFSADSQRAGAYAASLAEQHNARLILLHVRSEGDATASKAAVVERLESIASPAHLSGRTEVLVAEGRPTTKILEIAGEHSVDLIVVGVRGSGWSRALSHFGSTAHDIIAGASCPVLTARASNQE